MTEQTTSDRPNILVILSDQLRRQALSCHGDPEVKTPHIDKLADNGVRFQNACSTYPVCVPFRFTLMTGEYAHTRTIPAIEWSISPAERTLADEFNDAGYETVYVGKWHLDGGHGRMGSALQCGRTPVRRVNQGRWQKWYGFELRNDPSDTYYFEDDDPTPRPINGYQTDGLFDIGMNHLSERCDTEKPFCMMLSVEPPHDPYIAPGKLQQSWEKRDITLPENFEANNENERETFILHRKRYNAMVENLDSNVGRMMDFLKKEGLLDNTIVIFLADHGELNGSHGYEGKQWPYEESIGIPLIISDPRKRHRNGTVIQDPTCSEDLFPTLLGLAGLKPQNQLPGIDLTPLIKGQTDQLARPGIFLEFVAEHRDGMVFHDEVWRGFRTEKFKYTVKGDKFGGKPWQFFNLKEDPFEMNNLIDEPSFQEEITRHHHYLCDRLVETDDPFVLLPAFGCDGVNLWQEDS
jgi:arylsulfatase A-like enzyme